LKFNVNSKRQHQAKGNSLSQEAKQHISFSPLNKSIRLAKQERLPAALKLSSF